MIHAIDLRAPIVPGKSAAGFTLGTSIHSIDPAVLRGFHYEEVKNDFLKPEDRAKKYIQHDVVLYFERDTLTQIAVMRNYVGKIEGKLGIGRTVSEFEELFGGVKGDDEGNMVFSNLRGLCFECNQGDRSEHWEEEIRAMKVEEIYVFGVE